MTTSQKHPDTLRYIELHERGYGWGQTRDGDFFIAYVRSEDNVTIARGKSLNSPEAWRQCWETLGLAGEEYDNR